MMGPQGNAVWYTGPMFLGAVFSYFLSGCAFVQTVTFFQNNKLSRRNAYGITIVYIMSVLELVSLVVMTATVYHVMCISIPKGDLSFQTPRIALSFATLHTLAALVVQGHFALRIRHLTQGSWGGNVVVTLLAMMGVVQLGGSVAIVYYMSQINRDLSRLSYDVMQGRALMIWFIHTASSDVLVSLALVFIYWRFRRGTERAQSKSWLTGLILHTIENGAVLSIGAVVHFVVYITSPDNLVHLVIAYINCRLYANVLLVSINSSRRLQRDAATDFDNSSVDFSSPSPGTREGATTTSRRRHSLSGAIQRSSMVGTRTDNIEFTTLDSSKFTRSRANVSEVSYEYPEGYWKHGTLTKE